MSNFDILLLQQELKAKGFLRLPVKVYAHQKVTANGIVGMTESGSLKVRIKALREQGKANKTLKNFLAKQLNTKAINITIQTGKTSTSKILYIKS